MRTIVFVQFLSGALASGYAIAALFFFRFWRNAHDRLFGYFTAAFLLLSLQQVLAAVIEPDEPTYLVRLAAFVLILWAVIEKNRSR